jgi:hypothetical protein
MSLRVTKQCIGYVNVYLIFLFELCYFQEPSVYFPDSVSLVHASDGDRLHKYIVHAVPTSLTSHKYVLATMRPICI